MTLATHQPALARALAAVDGMPWLFTDENIPGLTKDMRQGYLEKADKLLTSGALFDVAALAEDAAQRVEREIRHLRAVPADVTTANRDAMCADLEQAADDIRALATALSQRAQS